MRDEREAPHEALGDFDGLVRAHANLLYRIARSLARDPDTADDLVQETFLRAYRSRGTFRGDATPTTWLRRILYHVAVDRGRREQEMPVASIEQVERKWRDDAYTVDAETVALRTESREELQDALARLPFIYRSAVVLHDVEGWTMHEVARTMALGLPAAKQRLRRGRMMLVSALAAGAERRRALAGVPMRCWDARAKISDYLDDDLPPDERTVLERHLEVCPTCPPLYACLVGVCEQLGTLRDPDSVVAPDLADRLHRTLAAERAQVPGSTDPRLRRSRPR